MKLGWPRELFLIRHAQSAGNVARERALAEGAAVIDIAMRDVDVPLSGLGERQARALGLWVARHVEPIDAIVASPYLRTRETAAIALNATGWNDVPLMVDERVREKEFGTLDRLTHRGIKERFPDQAKQRSTIGKFYYRPPGGESWTDVILRLRSLVETLTRTSNGKRIAIVTHQVIVLCFRYILENLSEAQLLEIDRAGEVANCSVTSYSLDPERDALVLQGYNVVAPLEEAGEPVTREPDAAFVR